MSLAEADLGLTQLAFEGGQPQEGDEQLLVKFFLQPEQNAELSVKEGRPIFRDLEYIQIQVPGQKDNIIIRPSFAEDQQRFPRHYAAFKNKDAVPIDGTLLSSWPGITRGQVEELKFFEVRTVEQLATLSDTHAQNFMGIQQLRTRARLFMESSKENAAAEKLAAELETRDNQIAAMQTAMDEMAAELKAMRDSGDAVSNSGGDPEPSRRRGRASTSK